MEWVETTGNNVEAATTEALNLLGIDASDAEIEVIDKEEIGWFGRVKSHARVRARIKPLPAQTAADNRNRRGRGDRQDGDSRDRSRRSRNRRGSGSANKSNKSSEGSSKDKSGTRNNKKDDRRRDGKDSGQDASRGGGKQAAAAAVAGGRSDDRAASDQGKQNDNKDRSGGRSNRSQAKEKTMEEFPVEEQTTLVKDFLEGLASLFDETATVTVTDADETLTAAVQGEDLGLLIGPKGQTLDALDEITRTVVQREANGRRYRRLNVDVDGYRERRREALVDFTKKLAEDVRESGVRKSLEPMRSSDRKIVHDTVSDIDGVMTLSEGNDPRRYVVIAPE